MPDIERAKATVPEGEDEREELGDAAPTLVETKFPLDIAKNEYSIYELHRRWEQKRLRLQPDFQRELVWSEDKQIKLVESVLARIPLPVIYLSDDGESFDVVDGQQRLTTLFAFMEGRFAEKNASAAIRRKGADQGQGRTFELRKLKLLKELEARTFETLDPKDRRRFEDTQLICFVLQPSTSPQAKFQIFGRLNEGTTPLNPQEIRNAIYRGPGLELVRRLAAPGSRFRAVAGAERSYARMRADELVLRGIAFSWRGWEGYKGDLKEFLNESLEALNKTADGERAEVERAFLHAVAFAERVFGQNAWQRYDTDSHEWSGHISGPLVEVVSTAAARIFPGALPPREQAAAICARFEGLCREPSFINAILTATQTVKNVRERMTAFERICRDAQ